MDKGLVFLLIFFALVLFYIYKAMKSQKKGADLIDKTNIINEKASMLIDRQEKIVQRQEQLMDRLEELYRNKQ